MDNNLFIEKCKNIHGDEYILDSMLKLEQN